MPSVVFRLLSFIAQAFVLLTGPVAMIGFIQQLFDTPGLLVHLPHYWNDQVRSLLPHFNWIDRLPDWSISAAYVCLLAATVAWAFWTGVALESRRLTALASAGALDPVAPQRTHHPVRATAGAIAPIAGTMFGVAAMLFGVFTLNPVAIGVGYASALAGSGVAVGHILLELGEDERNQAHADAQTRLLEESRRTRVRENVDAFKRSQLKKLKIGAIVAGIVVVANFALPATYGVLEYIDETFEIK